MSFFFGGGEEEPALLSYIVLNEYICFIGYEITKPILKKKKIPIQNTLLATMKVKMSFVG